METVSQVWNRITGKIQAEHNQANVNIFLKSIQPVRIEEGVLILEASNDFCRDWVERKYRTLIQKILQESSPALSCRFITVSTPAVTTNRNLRPVQPGLPTLVSNTIPGPESVGKEKAGNREDKPHGRMSGTLRQDSPLNAKYLFDSFVVGKSNQFAHAVCQAVAAAPGMKYNPVFIYGGVGLGKTHLLQAVGQEVLHNNPKAKIAYLSSEMFTNEFIDAVRDKTMNEFRAKYRKKDLLLIDDVQFFAGKEGVIEEFFHTFNELFQNKKQIVLSSDAPPKKINKLEERLVSRFEMGIVADVQAPDLEMRAAILKKAVARAVISVPDEVVMYLAQSVTTNIRELEGAFTRVVAYAGIVQKPIDRDLVDEVLKDFFRETAPGRITIPWIQRRVAEYYDTPEGEMTSKRRAQNLVLPRQVAMVLCQKLTSSSLSQIGSAFGGRDHTTVMHSVAKINARLKKEPAFAEEFERIHRSVLPPEMR
ncbi:MAG: chromosomal replication initiator protein DnaA [Candidatus Ozemobacteraceae bacterium]